MSIPTLPLEIKINQKKLMYSPEVGKSAMIIIDILTDLNAR